MCLKNAKLHIFRKKSEVFAKNVCFGGFLKQFYHLKMVRQWLADGRPPVKLLVKGLSRVGRIYAGMYGNLSLDE